MSDNRVRGKLFLFGILVSMFFPAHLSFASITNGTIDTTDKYAWGENIGWINFGCSGCGVAVTDSGLTGYAWSSQYGWINLNPTNSGVSNTSAGTLSGFAWSSSLGWINFTGVTINTSGEFLGYATVDSDSSQINFNCVNGLSCASSDFKVKTDWIPASARPTVAGASSGSRPQVPPPPAFFPPVLEPILTPIVNVADKISDVIKDTSDFFSGIFDSENDIPIAKVPEAAPLSMKGLWNLLPEKQVNSFVFAPLPYEIRILASKFPELDKTFKNVGVDRFSDLNKLTGVNLNIPGLTDTLSKTITTIGLENMKDIDAISGVAIDLPGMSDLGGALPSSVGTGKITLIKGIPVAKFSVAAKKNLPAEFVFARAKGELVDLNVVLSVGEKGQVSQKMSSLPGEALRLVVKPISKARNVTGYFIFKAATPKVSENTILRSSLVASALFSMNGLVEQVPKTSPPAPLLDKERVALNSFGPDEVNLVLSSFEYEDLDGDGIYTADVVTPTVAGEYEVITVIEYIDPVLGSRKMSMVTVIDPEGYIFEKRDGKETRIPSAIVSIYRLNTATKQYELWNASDYSQENPQVTDIRGTYSFLVPEGSYYFHVEAPGYKPYEGKVFVVAEGAGVHQNIELSSGGKWLADFDWQTILLIVVFLLLVYNLYRNTLRDKLLKLNK